MDNKKYIELEKLIAILEDEHAKSWLLCMPEERKKDYAAGIYNTIKIAKKMLAADVREVVRCKDCKHRYISLHCALWQGTYNGNDYFIDRGENFSCSYGEKGGAENDL